MKLGRGGVKDGGGNGGNRGIIELRRNGRDSKEFADVNAMSSRLVFRPKGSKFRGSHGVGTRRDLKEEKVKWAVIAIRFTKGWHKGWRRRVKLRENVLKNRFGMQLVKVTADDTERVGTTSISSKVLEQGFGKAPHMLGVKVDIY